MMNKLISISELSRILDFIDPVQKTSKSYCKILGERIKEIRPKKINNRRYYSIKQGEMIKMIKFLLKNKGLTIAGAKNLIKSNINKLDDANLSSLRTDYYKISVKTKSKKLLEKINKLKNYGKKNTP